METGTPPPLFCKKSPQVTENKRKHAQKERQESSRACKLLSRGYLKVSPCEGLTTDGRKQKAPWPEVREGKELGGWRGISWHIIPFGYLLSREIFVPFWEWGREERIIDQGNSKPAALTPKAAAPGSCDPEQPRVIH